MRYGYNIGLEGERISKTVKWFRYRPGVAQRVGRGIALLFHDCGTRRGWVVSNTRRPHFTPGKDPVPILQETGWAPGPVWTGGKSRPHRDSIPDRPARSQSLYRLSYPAHERISGEEKKNGDDHNEIVLRETIQAEYPRISTVATWSYRKANKLQPMVYAVYLQPYGGTAEIVKFILKTFPGTDATTIWTSVKLLSH